MDRRVSAFALAGLLVILVVPSASASTITYNNVAAFSAAATGVSVITFEAQQSGSFNFVGFSGLTDSGVQFTAPLSHYLYVVADTAVNPAYQWNSGASLLFGSTDEGGNLVIQLSAGVTAFGFDLMAQADSAPDSTAGTTFNILVDGNPFSATTLTRPNRAFFGITSTTPISQVVLTFTNPFIFRALPIIDNVRVGTAAAAVTTPEPCTLALVGLGLAGAVRRRRRR